METVAEWLFEDRRKLAEAAREIEARRTGVYRLSDEERAEVEAGLAEAHRGAFASDAEVAALWKRAAQRRSAIPGTR